MHIAFFLESKFQDSPAAGFLPFLFAYLPAYMLS